jgi:hypothetical protein
VQHLLGFKTLENSDIHVNAIMAKTKMYVDEAKRSHFCFVSPVASFYFPSLFTPGNGMNVRTKTWTHYQSGRKVYD